MKKILICALVFISAAMFQTASAQFKVTNNVELQPKWAPAGHDYVEYYYLPEIDTYYYVPRKQFIYQTNGHWTFTSSLPAANKRYNLFSANKVVVNEVGAYRYNAQHKIKYAGNQTASNASAVKPDSKSKDKPVRDQEKLGG